MLIETCCFIYIFIFIYISCCFSLDFSEELSRLTLSEKPSSLYDQSASPDFFKSYSSTGNSSTTTPNSTGTAPSKPLLWATIVSQTAVHPTGKTNVPFDPNCKSKSDQFTRSGTDSVNKKNEKKLGFDHSSVRSQSGKRKSTGISTSDQKRDHSSSSKAKHEYSLGKHEYSSGKHEYSVGKQKDSSEKFLTVASEKKFKGETSSLTKTKREVLVDGKRIQGATEGSSKSQRVLKNINNDFPTGEARSKKQVPRENGADFFSIKREEENQTPSAKQYEESNLRNGASRSPSWRRSQTVGSSSSRSKTAETCELSRSVSSGRVASMGGISSVKNKAVAEKDKWQQTKSRKASLLHDNGSKRGEATSAVKPEAKAEGTAKRRRKNRKKKTGVKEDREIEEKDLAAENNNSSLSVGPSILMQFDDDDEFPGLLYAAQVSLNEISSGPIKYSDILSGRAVS